MFFEALNGIAEKVMVNEGRVYGGGMHKLEPRELSNVPSPELLRSIMTFFLLQQRQRQDEY